MRIIRYVTQCVLTGVCLPAHVYIYLCACLHACLCTRNNPWEKNKHKALFDAIHTFLCACSNLLLVVLICGNSLLLVSRSSLPSIFWLCCPSRYVAPARLLPDQPGIISARRRVQCWSAGSKAQITSTPLVYWPSPPAENASFSTFRDSRPSAEADVTREPSNRPEHQFR